MPRKTRSKRRRVQPPVDVARTTHNSDTKAAEPSALPPEHPTVTIIQKMDSMPEASTSTTQPPTSVDIAANLPVAQETAPSDLDLAFELQMEEAIAASMLPSASTTDVFPAAPGVFSIEREQANLAEVQRIRKDFDIQYHDRKVASDIIAISDEEWQVTGDNYARPYSIGSTSATGGSDLRFCEQYMLYFKGLVLEDKKNKAKFGAIGVAIFDSTNAVVFEVSKTLDLAESELRDEVAELEAFVQGIEFAFSLELVNVTYVCVDFDVDHYLNANQQPNDAKVAELVQGAVHLKKRFLRCNSSAATESNAKFVLGLARSSIEKQSGKTIKEIIVIKETCPICFEDVDSEEMFEFGSCHHCFCYSCLQKHVELKVTGRELPRCPQLNCELELTINDCRKFVTRKMYDILDQFIKESSIPVTEKVYCPNPRCSNLMSKMEALANNGSIAGSSTVELTVSTCVKCHTQFCMKCKVLWHSNMSCDVYKKQKLDPRSPDAKLKLLAGDEKWRQCPMCYHMVELVIGCNHIYCRCGHQFCYLCGSEWKDKKATCSCPLWSEDKIILGGAANLQ